MTVQLLGSYQPKNTFIHTLEGRVKFVLLLFIMTFSIFIKSLSGLVLLFIFTLLCYKVSKLTLKDMIDVIKPLIVIIVFLTIYHVLVSKEGNVLFSLSFIRITDIGVKEALFYNLRMVDFILISSLLTMTTSTTVMFQTFQSLAWPLRKLKVPVAELSMMITIALRFVPIILTEATRIMNAQKMRGISFEGVALRERIRNYQAILIPLLVSCIIRAEQMGIALQTKHFDPKKIRKQTNHLKRNGLEVYGIFAVLLLFIFVGYAERWW